MLTESQGELTHLIRMSWSIAGEWSIDGEVPSLHGKQVGETMERVTDLGTELQQDSH